MYICMCTYIYIYIYIFCRSSACLRVRLLFERVEKKPSKQKLASLN